MGGRIAAVWLATLFYPLAIYLGLDWLEPRALAVLLLAIAVGRALVSRDRAWWLAAAGAGVLVAITLVANRLLPLKLYPVLVNAVMLALFGLSLRRPPSMVERLARLREPHLPDAAIAYTRRVTQVWCVFFVFNGSVALATALWATDRVWALYNGLVAYLLMGILFAGEWLVRRQVRADAGHG